MIVSSISNKNIKPSEAIKASDIRESLLSFIQKNHPEFSNEGYISYEELNFFRRLYITELVIQEKGELAKIDEDVVEAIRSNAVLSENIEEKITCSTITQEFGRKKEILGEGMASLKADSEQKAAAKAIENLRRKGISKPVPAIYSFFS